MNKKLTFTIVFIAFGFVLAAFSFLGATSQAKGAETQAEWFGTWQMGPSLDATILGCPAGNGLGRHTGIYYPANDKVYFLGGRCENNTTTTGKVFYFDPVTGTYAATVATMPVPVSNYQMVQVDDDGRGHGPGFYIIGGRTTTGSQTNAVQVFYPNDNTVAQITTDPFPPAVLYSPGGVVSVGGKIYVFGGFTGTVMDNRTYIYDPAADEGSRWTLTACNLPTARSYIAAVAVGDHIYAMGGDEYTTTLVPLNDTLVLDTTDLASCWQDDLMPDLPAVNGDAPAAYINDGYLGGESGGIYVVGGNFTAIQRLVFRYDFATDTWDTFPDLVIPDPATGRRNQALAYIPAVGGRPARLWTFGGYDGSGTNAMTETAEFFANTLLQADDNEVEGMPGMTVTDYFTQINLSVVEHTYDLAYTSDVTWTVTLPPTVGPVPADSNGRFAMQVDIPASAGCGDTGSFTVTSTAQDDARLTAEATILVRAICGVGGTVTDANSGLPIESAYVWIQDSVDGLGKYYDGFTDANGNFFMQDVLPDDYYFGSSALHHQPSFYPAGWPDGAILITVGADPVLVNVALVASDISWDPTAVTVDVVPNSTAGQSLTINNNGTGPYYYNISLVNGDQSLPPQGVLAVPGLPRVDEQIFSDIVTSIDGTADFVVVMGDQADVSSAYGIADWAERGQAVYDMLTSHAETSQAGLRSFLTSQKVEYTPLYIINAVIVHSGGVELVNMLSARPDVAQLVANHKIAVEEQTASYLDSLFRPVTAPEAVEWNITKVKAPSVWALGYTGQNTVVAEIDTGTQYDHPALVNQYRGNMGGGIFDHDYNWFDPYGQCPSGGTVPCDPGDHGTHVMGTMVGDDGATNQIGVAPGAKWISCKGGDAVSGYLLTNELLVCAQWILAPTDVLGSNPDPAMRPNVVNNSWGGGPNDYWYTGAIAAWRAAGIFPAFANGNAGPACSTAHSPGDNWHSFATGASDISNNIGGFSSRGPAEFTGFLKPQITAPGVNIRSSVPGGGYAGGWNGTSMASPHSAAAVALLYSAAPELIGQVDLTAWVLEQTATPLYTTDGCGGDLPSSHPNNTFGYGLLDTLAAVNLALGGNLTPDWVTVEPQSGLVNPGATETITLTFTAPVDLGVYTSTLWLVGDDPNHSDVRIPLTMNVVPGNAVTFVYHDLENVVLADEDVYVTGTWDGWTEPGALMTPNADFSVFTATVPLLDGTYEYRYFMPELPAGLNWYNLNTANHAFIVTGDVTVNDYRNVLVDLAHLADPLAVTIYLGDDSGNLNGEVLIQNVTNFAGEGRGIKAQLGYGTSNLPADWAWINMTYAGDNGKNDMFTGVLTPGAVGVYNYGVRFDGNWGVGNPNQAWADGDQTGLLTVLLNQMKFFLPIILK